MPVILQEGGGPVDGTSASLTEWLIRQATNEDSPKLVRGVVDEFDEKVLGTLYAFLRCPAKLPSPALRSGAVAGIALSGRWGTLKRNLPPPASRGRISSGRKSLWRTLRFSACCTASNPRSPIPVRAHQCRAYRGTPCLTRGLAACEGRPSFQDDVTPKPEEIVEFYKSDDTYHPERENKMLDAWVARMLDGTQAIP